MAIGPRRTARGFYGVGPRTHALPTSPAEPIERRFIQTSTRRPQVTARLGGTRALATVEEMLSRHHLATFQITLRRHESGDNVVDILFKRSVSVAQLVGLADRLRSVEEVRSVSYSAPDEPHLPPT
ncbi:MAG: hypothetical protein KC543_08455 [Myxococcales bacterium]|nr:hypothetical protein [Myxococcales bacterium]